MGLEGIGFKKGSRNCKKKKKIEERERLRREREIVRSKKMEDLRGKRSKKGFRKRGKVESE